MFFYQDLIFNHKLSGGKFLTFLCTYKRSAPLPSSPRCESLLQSPASSLSFRQPHGACPRVLCDRCTLALLGQPRGELPWVRLNSCLFVRPWVAASFSLSFEYIVTHSVLISISQSSGLGDVGIQAGISNDLADINVRGGGGLKLGGVEGTCCEGDSIHLSECFVPFIYEDNCLEHHISLPHAKKLCQYSCVYIKSIFFSISPFVCLPTSCWQLFLGRFVFSLSLTELNASTGFALG